MRLEWSSVVKEGELWGWRLYDTGRKPYSQWHIRGEVQYLLCETKRPIKLWMFSAKVDKHRKKVFYTGDEAKAWAIAIVRMQ